jgi:hypothetical protein
MPPLTISDEELVQLVEATARGIAEIGPQGLS